KPLRPSRSAPSFIRLPRTCRLFPLSTRRIIAGRAHTRYGARTFQGKKLSNPQKLGNSLRADMTVVVGLGSVPTAPNEQYYCGENDMQMKKILVGATGALLLTGALATTAIAQDERCKGEKITAAGKATFWGDKRAQRLAIDNWQREVRQKYGEQFMDFTKARQGRVDCGEAGIGAVGSHMKRCNVSGYPCHVVAAADDEEADKDWDDKDRRGYAVQRKIGRAS